jgi:hypothetical protein
VRYRLVGVSSLGRWSPQLPTGYFVPGRTQEHQHTRLNFPYPAITVFGGVFQTPSGRASAIVCSSAELRLVSYNPIVARAAALAPGWFGRFPVRSPLLRGYCLFLGLREMFQLARCPPHKCGNRQKRLGCPIRRSWDQSVLAAPPRVSSRCHVRRRHPPPRHPSSAPSVLPDLLSAQLPALYILDNSEYAICKVRDWFHAYRTSSARTK